MSDCICEFCKLIRGPLKIKLETRTTGCQLNFSLDGNPQFNAVPVEEGIKTVEIYECSNIAGYKTAYVTIVGVKE